MSRPKDSANNIQSRRTKTPTALIIHSAARSIVAFRLSSKNRPQRYRSYGSGIFPPPREMNQITKVPAIVITVAMITLRRKERAGGALFSIRDGAGVVVARGQWPLMLTGVPRSIQL